MPDTDSGRWWAGKRWYELSAASGMSCCNTINSGQCLGGVHPKQLTYMGFDLAGRLNGAGGDHAGEIQFVMDIPR
jgi:hypothetical protein